MHNINLFQYLAAFVTIVLALALSDLLMSAHRLIVARKRVTWSIVPLAAALFVLLNILSEFFSVWVAADVPAVSFLYLTVLVFVSSTAAMAAFAVLPDEVPPEGIDLWQTYLDRHTYIYSVMALGAASDVLRSALHDIAAHQSLIALAPRFYLTAGAVVVLLALLAWAKDWRLHAGALVVLYAVACNNFFNWTIR